MSEFGSDAHTPPPAASERRRFWQRFLTFWEWIVERDHLPRDEEEAPIQATGPSPFAWLTSPDPLPSHTESPPRRRGFLRWLASRDQLPSREDSPHHRQAFVAWLASRQQLPTGSPEGDLAPRSFFRWLLTSEGHELLNHFDSTKEVAPHEP